MREPPGVGVTFRLFASARAAAGTAEVRTPAGSIADAIEALLAGRGERLGDVVAHSTLLHDGRALDPTSSDELPEGAVVDVLPPFAGG
jgi:sulfur-carrier protein